MQELVGKVISKIEVSNGEEYIRFTHPSGASTIYYASGDCCSESWFADIIIGGWHWRDHMVSQVDELELPQPYDARSRQEYDQAYGYKIVLVDYCYIDIVFRNSSNGYYGGNLSYIEPDNPYFDEQEWVEIKESWSA